MGEKTGSQTERESNMINEKYTDGKDKPPGLYAWQLRNDVHDENPFYEIGNLHFSLLAMLPRYLADLAVERETAAREHRQHLAELDARHASIRASLTDASKKQDRATQSSEIMLMRQERILAHLCQIESDFGVNVVGNLNYDRIAMPLQARVESICAKLPLDRLEQQAQHITHSGDKIELAAYKIDTIADAIAAAKDTKRELYLLMAGAFTGSAMLVFLVFILSSSAHVIVNSASPAANSVPAPAVSSAEPATQ